MCDPGDKRGTTERGTQQAVASAGRQRTIGWTKAVGRTQHQFFLSHSHAQLVSDYVINTNKASTGPWFSERGPQTYRIRKSEAGALPALQVTVMLAPLGEPLGQCTEARASA